jgi:hypothetical protein
VGAVEPDRCAQEESQEPAGFPVGQRHDVIPFVRCVLWCGCSVIIA